jgi:protein SCO1
MSLYRRFRFAAPACVAAGALLAWASVSSHGALTGAPAQSYPASGVVQRLGPEPNTVVVRHRAIANYMDAMTMPFHARNPQELAGLNVGDEVSFVLRVTETESWIEQIVRIGRGAPAVATQPLATNSAGSLNPHPRHPLLSCHFTNELGQAVSLDDFRGQALALTFFFTRCPVPDYCPRLSKNFQDASRKLSARPGAPTNWHFLSVSFDTEHDTPAVLKAYALRHEYDTAHWSFWTGAPEQIAELAALSDVTFERDGAFFSHNFRTLIIDATGQLQTTFPIGGNLSEAIAAEILKAATATNRPGAGNTGFRS